MPPEDNIISWSEWEEKYVPIPNPLSDGFNGNIWDCFFDQDVSSVEAMANSGYHVWTVVDNNPNSVYLDIIPGYRMFNRMGWFVTEKSWADKDMVVSNDKSYY